MTAHKHAEMIKAKADNMELAVFCERNGKWIEVTCEFSQLAWRDDKRYFLCLQKHKKAVLCGLNGGNFQVRCLDEFSEGWYLNPSDWGRRDIWYMLDSHESRIKPRKENRWIAACNSGYNCIDKLFDNKNQAKEFVTAFYPNNRVGDFQFIEIEIEV